jgi:transposase-like protein
MSQKRQKKTYSAKEKSTMVLALLENEKTLSEIASQYEVHPNPTSSKNRHFEAKG